MSGSNSYEEDGWVIVNETKSDGSCDSPGSVDDIALLSDDEENWDSACHNGANHNQRRAGSNTASSTRRSIKVPGHADSSRIRLDNNMSNHESSYRTPGQENQRLRVPQRNYAPSPLPFPATGPRRQLDPKQAAPRGAQDPLMPTNLTGLFPQLQDKLQDLTLKCKDYRDKAYISDNTHVSTARSYDEWKDEMRPRTRQNTRPQQYAPGGAAFRQHRNRQSPEETAHLKVLQMNDESDHE